MAVALMSSQQLQLLVQDSTLAMRSHGWLGVLTGPAASLDRRWQLVAAGGGRNIAFSDVAASELPIL